MSSTMLMITGKTSIRWRGFWKGRRKSLYHLLLCFL